MSSVNGRRSNIRFTKNSIACTKQLLHANEVGGGLFQNFRHLSQKKRNKAFNRSMIMTESEWISGDDSRRLLDFMRDKAEDRLFYLFAAACCRRSWSLLTNPASRVAVEVTEGLADGLLGREATRIAAAEACEVEELKCFDVTRDVAEAAATLLRGTPMYAAQKCDAYITRALAIVMAGEPLLTMDDMWMDHDEYVRAQKQANADVARDIFRHPSQPLPKIDTEWLDWRDAAIPRMCQRMYDSMDFGLMKGLGRSLHIAGCTDEEILDHCQSNIPHFRGCWLIDSILGKRGRTKQ